MSKPSKITPGGFHHVALKVRDFDASLRFYMETLGFVQVMAWGQGDGRAAMLDTGDGSCLELFAGGGEIKPDSAILHFAFRCDDPDGAIERVRAAGAAVTMEPRTLEIPNCVPPATVRFAFCKGPDGEQVEFFRRLK